MRKFYLCILIIPLIVSADTWWEEAETLYKAYKRAIYESAHGRIWAWNKIETTTTDNFYKFSWKVGAGFIPPYTKKYNVAALNAPIDFRADCNGIWLHSNIEAFFDSDQLKNWLINFATNTVYYYLLSLLYSNNTVAQLLTFMENLGSSQLSLTAARCNNTTLIKMSNDERYKALSWSQKLCVSAVMTADPDKPYYEAIEECSNNAAAAAAGSMFDSKAEVKSCYSILQFNNDENLTKALLGYYTKEISGDKFNWIYHAPTLDIPTLVDSFITLHSAYFDSIEMIYKGTFPGDETYLYQKLQQFVSKLSPPNAPVDPAIIHQAINSDEYEKQAFKLKIVSTSSYFAAVYIISRLNNFITSCATQKDARVNEEEIKKYRERLKVLTQQLQNMHSLTMLGSEFARDIAEAEDYLARKSSGVFLQTVLQNANRISTSTLHNNIKNVKKSTPPPIR